MKYYVAVTRFNNDTYKQNIDFKIKYNIKGCFYNSPVKITDGIPIDSNIIVLEMNNDLNLIMGIGLITNSLKFGKKYKQYDENCYNRYPYNSKYRIDRQDIINYTISIKDNEISLLRCLEILCFTGNGHSKRGHGITLLPDKRRIMLEDKNIKNHILNIFKKMHTEIKL